MKKKIVWLVIIFLLLVPFRLPIGVLFINLVSWTADLAGGLSDKVLAANVTVTKLIYNAVLVAISIRNIEKISRLMFGGDAQDNHRFAGNPTYWWSVLIGIMLGSYAIFDTITTYNLYYELQNIPIP